MNQTQLPPLGQAEPRHRLPVVLVNEMQNIGTILQNCYLQELLAPRLYGKLLNIGAGTASARYRHGEMFGVEEYHTLEPAASMACTFVASATDMKPVESAHYDWVMSTAVLEHVDDAWAAAKEHVRAAKPGGLIYVVVPFEQIMHPAPDFGDYWRFTPQGMRTMFPTCQVLEIETWGDNPAAPNGFGMLLRKPDASGALTELRERYYWLEFDNEDPFALTLPAQPPSYEWALHEVNAEPMKLAMELNRVRDTIYQQQQIPLRTKEVAQRYKTQFCRTVGFLGTASGTSYFRKV